MALTGVDGQAHQVWLEVAAPGEHMASNAVAALPAGLELLAELERHRPTRADSLVRLERADSLGRAAGQR